MLRIILLPVSKVEASSIKYKFSYLLTLISSALPTLSRDPTTEQVWRKGWKKSGGAGRTQVGSGCGLVEIGLARTLQKKA